MIISIRDLTPLSTLTGGESVPVYSPNQGDDRRVSLTDLTTYLQSALTFNASVEFTTQRAAPNATGFNIQISDTSDTTHLILTPVAGYGAGTITLPALANCVDKQEVLVNCTQAVTALTVDGNGSTVTGAPTTLAANDFFRLKYDLATTVWYRVG